MNLCKAEAPSFENTTTQATCMMACGRTRASPSKGGSPVAVKAVTCPQRRPLHSAAGDTNIGGVRLGGTSPIAMTQIDGFSIEERPNLGIEGSANDPSLVLQDNKVQNVGAGQSIDWVIKGVEDLDGNACNHMLAF
jgi:hypothetical protein